MKLRSLKTLSGTAGKFRRMFVPLAMLIGMYNTASATPGTCYGVTIGAPSCASSFVSTHPGGTWTTSNASVVTVDGAGNISTVGVGTATITYTYTDPSACGSFTYFYPVTVDPPPPISGTDTICIATTTSLTAVPSGGTWISGATGVATVGSSSGIVTGVSSGTANITYTSPAGCTSVKTIFVGQPFGIHVCKTSPLANCDTAVTYNSSLEMTVYDVPAGYTPTWSPSIPATMTTGSTTATFNFTGSPSVTQTYTVSVTKQGCTAKDIVTIAVPSGGCSPDDYFKPAACSTVAPYTTLYGPLTSANVSTTTPGYYYVANTTGSPTAVATYSLTVSPAPGSVFMMDKNVKLLVPSTATVLLDGCHFFGTSTCQWTGIEVQHTSGSTEQLRITGNTLIEYASKGVAFASGTLNIPASGPNIIESDGAIYNNNTTGIYISEQFGQTRLPFLIKNSVFAAKNFSGYSLPGATCADISKYYPFVWPTAADLKSTTGIGNDPSYGIDAYPAGVTTGLTGVWLFWIGKSVFTGTGTPSFPSVTVGDPGNAADFNLFDLNASSTGCLAQYSNSIFYNNVFRRLTKGVAGVQDANKNAMQLYAGSVANTNNRFYNCATGIYAIRTVYFVSENSLIAATNTNSPRVVKGGAGIDLISDGTNGMLYKHIVKSNTILNCEYGVKLRASTCNGELTITDNTVTGMTTSTGTEYALAGIHLVVDGGSSCAYPSTLTVTNNTITGCVSGIGGYSQNQETYIDNNTIKMIQVPGAGLPTPSGIFINRWNEPVAKNNNKLKSVSYNHVYGDGTSFTWSSPAPAISRGSINDVTSGTFVGVRGIQLEKAGASGEPTVVSCNYVHDLPIGFNFMETNYLDWRNNVMTRNTYGMMLQTANLYQSLTHYVIPASIGDQGSACNPGDNYWDAGGSGWPGWNSSTGPWQTFTLGMDPAATTSSKLYVRNVTGYNPTANGTRNNDSTSVANAAYTASGSTPSIDVCTGTVTPTAPVQCGPFYAEGGGAAGRPAAPLGRSMPEISAPEETYTIFPNPAEDNISIKSGTASNESIQVNIRNYASASVYSGELQLKSGTTSVKLPNVAPGVYMLEVKNGNGAAHNYKLVIQPK